MKGLAEDIKSLALREGFAAAGICSPDSIPHAAARLSEYLRLGYHGQMGWMERRASWRGSPRSLWPAARSVIMLADNYGPGSDPLAALERVDRGVISVYAQNEDYHDVVKRRLKRVARWLVSKAPDSEVKVFVDTAPVMEKPLAQASGLGWQGKHTNLVARGFGSWVFLGAIFTTADLPFDDGESDHCGSCRRCLDICPTKAFPRPYQLDARKCISYLTIEHEGPVDPALRPALGNRIYGCDDCLAVCPWNKFASRSSEIRYHARAELESPALSDLAALDDSGFRALFRKSPVKRIGVGRFIRNVLYAIGNSGDARLSESARRHLDSPDATVRDAAGWALGQLGTA